MLIVKTNVFGEQSFNLPENVEFLLKQKDNYKNLYTKDTSKHFSPVKNESLKGNQGDLVFLKPTNYNPMSSQEYHPDLKKEYNIKKNAISDYSNAVAQYANISKKNLVAKNNKK